MEALPAAAGPVVDANRIVWAFDAAATEADSWPQNITFHVTGDDEGELRAVNPTAQPQPAAWTRAPLEIMCNPDTGNGYVFGVLHSANSYLSTEFAAWLSCWETITECDDHFTVSGRRSAPVGVPYGRTDRFQYVTPEQIGAMVWRTWPGSPGLACVHPQCLVPQPHMHTHMWDRRANQEPVRHTFGRSVGVGGGTPTGALAPHQLTELLEAGGGPGGAQIRAGIWAGTDGWYRPDVAAAGERAHYGEVDWTEPVVFMRLDAVEGNTPRRGYDTNALSAYRWSDAAALTSPGPVVALIDGDDRLVAVEYLTEISTWSGPRAGSGGVTFDAYFLPSIDPVPAQLGPIAGSGWVAVGGDELAARVATIGARPGRQALPC